MLIRWQRYRALTRIAKNTEPERKATEVRLRAERRYRRLSGKSVLLPWHASGCRSKSLERMTPGSRSRAHAQNFFGDARKRGIQEIKIGDDDELGW